MAMQNKQSCARAGKGFIQAEWVSCKGHEEGEERKEKAAFHCKVSV